MEAFGLVEKEYASIKGVAMEPFVFSGSRTFTLFRDIQLTLRTRWEWSWEGCCARRGSLCSHCSLICVSMTNPLWQLQNCKDSAKLNSR